MKKISKKDAVLLGILVIVIIITLVVLIKPKRQQETPTTPFNKIFSTNNTSQSKQDLQLPSSDIFEHGLENDQRFRDLREFEVRIDEGIKVGKDNPFEPFNY